MNLSEYQKIYDIILSGNINIITDRCKFTAWYNK